MIPRIIHYIWLGGKAIPANLQSYIEGWHRLMPCVGERLMDGAMRLQVNESESESERERERQWIYKKWDERTLADTLGEDWLQQMPLYVQQAYAAKKFAFVSDYIRLWALERYGGIYLDTDVEVIRSFDSLPEFLPKAVGQPSLASTSFIGFEESLAHLPGTCVMGCEAHCLWVREMLATYKGAKFIQDEGRMDMTTNVQRLGNRMVEDGLIQNGKEQYIEKWGLHVYDFHQFSPITSTRVMRKTKNTFTIHHFAGSWTGNQKGNWYDHPLYREVINALIQLKRFLYRQK